MNLLLSTGIALFAGLMMTRLFKVMHLNLPDVTAFLLAGILVGPYMLGRLGISGIGFGSMDEISQVGFLSNVALGFIAFDIGNEFRLAQLKHTGKAATIIGIVQAVSATVFVDAALIALHFILGPEKLPLPVAVTLGAIAAATAPAATLMVVRQYKAKGPLTDLLLPIVALDDAVGLVLFAVSFGVAQALDGGSVNLISVLVNPLLEIVCSLVLGALMGGLLTLLEKIFYSNKNRLSMTIAFVVTTIALSMLKIPLGGGVKISFSSLLVCMMLGTIFCNMSEYSTDIMQRSERWTAPLYTVFFVLSGAQLELSVFKSPAVILIGVVFIVIRCAGKYVGSYLPSLALKLDPKVRNHLGITLFPQAGVALGMVVSAQALGEAYGSIIRNIVLFAVLIYELVGPMLTKQSLQKAGEIAPAKSEKANRERFPKKAKAN
ncbi:MAG: cation:proton antiporter [Clostridia bacterium]|nr:cation:proton antiporter [Clostridia bacterium]